MTDNTTLPSNEPIKPGEPNTQLHHPPPGSKNVPGTGHWYSEPGQQPSAFPRPDVAPPSQTRDRGRRRTARDRVRRRKVRRELGAPDDWAWVIIAAALLGVTVVMSMTIFFLVRATQSSGTSVTSAPPIEPTSVIYGPGGILETTDSAPAGGLLGNGESMIIRPWDGKERFTVLVMGMDRRPGEPGTAFRTDTLILVSIDPNAKRVGLLSIPRDLYVDVPGYGLQRVNAAYALGEYEGSGGGPNLAMQTVQYNLGIRVNDYVVIDFNAFIKIIDLIGGVDVNVPTAIHDDYYPDMNYGYDPFYIEAGWQHLDGQTALKYARSRHTSDDIDRARRQQQVIYAVRDKVIALDMIPKLAAQAPALWSELDAGTDTGLSLDQVLQLAWYVKDIPAANFTNNVLGWEYVTPVDWNGQSILVPNRYTIGELMLQVFGSGYNQ
jgi:LCP family protein required for cell wall assembly